MIPVGKWGKEFEDMLYTYPFNSESIVFDLGCYVGNFADKFSKRYNCKVYGFEPIEHFLEELKNKQNSNIITFNYGLGAKNYTEEIIIHEAGTTLKTFDRGFNTESSNYNENPEIIKIEIRDIVEVLKELNLPKIDLMNINTEGSEMDILPPLIESGLINTIDYLQVQFHNFVPDAENKYLKLKSEIAKTHTITIDQPWKWTLFKLKNK